MAEAAARGGDGLFLKPGLFCISLGEYSGGGVLVGGRSAGILGGFLHNFDAIM